MDINNLVYGYDTQFKEGFTQKEIDEILEKFKGEINMEKYHEAMRGNTCVVIEGKVITYHCDLITGIRCGVENRSMTWLEWD